MTDLGFFFFSKIKHKTWPTWHLQVVLAYLKQVGGGGGGEENVKLHSCQSSSHITFSRHTSGEQDNPPPPPPGLVTRFFFNGLSIKRVANFDNQPLLRHDDVYLCEQNRRRRVVVVEFCSWSGENPLHHCMGRTRK